MEYKYIKKKMSKTMNGIKIPRYPGSTVAIVWGENGRRTGHIFHDERCWMFKTVVSMLSCLLS